MKKQLLTALLTFTAISCSATPSDTELLAHLKNVKKDIEKAQEKLAQQSADDVEFWGEKNYFFLLNMVNEIDQQLNYSLKNKIFNNNAIESLCNDMKTVDDVIENASSIMSMITINSNDFFTAITKDEKEIELIKSIFEKHHMHYCQSIIAKGLPKTSLEESIINSQFIELYWRTTLWPFLLNAGMEWLQNLKQEVDAKIAELEQA